MQSPHEALHLRMTVLVCWVLAFKELQNIYVEAEAETMPSIEGINFRKTVYLTMQFPPFRHGLGLHTSLLSTLQFVPPHPGGQLHV